MSAELTRLDLLIFPPRRGNENLVFGCGYAALC
jgi:hypothetical protein